MIKIPDSVLIFYLTVSVLGFALRFFKDGVLKMLSIEGLRKESRLFLAVLLPVSALLFMAQKFTVLPENSFAYFASAGLLSFLLYACGLPSYLRGILLLAAGVAFTSLAQCDFVGLAAALCGLLLQKLTENVCGRGESSLDDFAAPFIWLSSVMWLSSLYTGTDLQLKAGVVLGVMSASLLMRFLQGPFVAVGKSEDDRFFLKRVMLSLTAGIVVLLVLVKMLKLMDLQYLAALCAAGYFIIYIYKDKHGDERYFLPAQQSLKLLVLIGLLTIVSTRFFGNFGLIALAPTALVAPVSSVALFPGIYFGSRVLLDVYLQHFNMNVTGINLTHAYAGAAQYAGFLVGVAMLLLFKEKMEKRVLLFLLLAASVATPVLSNFLLHAEPTCSLFVSVLVSSFLLSVVGPALQGIFNRGGENLSLIPALMISCGILTNGLIESGKSAGVAARVTALAVCIAFLLLSSFVIWLLSQRKASVTASSAAASGE